MAHSNSVLAAQVIQINKPSNTSILSDFYTVTHENKQVITVNSFTRSANNKNKLQPIRSTPLSQFNLNATPGALVTNRYEQLYNDIPIWGKQIITHEQAGVTSVTGTLIKKIHTDIVNTTPKLTAIDAKNIALNTIHKVHPAYIIQSTDIKTKLFIYIEPSTNNAVLIYQVKLPTYQYLINANSGKIIQFSSLIKNLDAIGLGGNNFPAYYTSAYQRSNEYSFVLSPSANLEYGPLDVSSSDGGITCTTVNDVITTFNMGNLTLQQLIDTYGFEGDANNGVVGTSDLIQSASIQALIGSFTCAIGNLDVVENPAQTSPTTSQTLKTFSPLNDSHFFASESKKMYENTFNVSDPYNGHVYVFTHINNLLNAYAYVNDPTYPNQFWVGNGEPTDPDAWGITLSSADVISHELGHLVTDHNSSLIYANESGGINEAFSDMAGIAMLQYLQDTYPWTTIPQQFNPDMWVGGTIYTDSPYFLRNMSNPPADGNSIDNVADYYSGMDVHFSSGIYNKAFYNLATTSGWGINKAFKVMLQANQSLWTPSETFDNGLCGIYNAADQLDYSLDDKKDICLAFKPTGVICPVTNSECDFTTTSDSDSDNNDVTTISIIVAILLLFVY